MSKTILTVDDSSTIRQMVTFVLKEAGYTVHEAVDGQQAIDLMSSSPVDMVITDLNMPNVNGVELIRWTRADARHKFIPVVMLTTESQEDIKREGRAAGATGWIVKPFKPEQLLNVVGKVLG